MTKIILIGAIACVLSGCTSLPGIIEAMAKDPATVCVSIAGPYPAVISRTNLSNGEVNCSGQGLVVKSPPAPPTP